MSEERTIHYQVTLIKMTCLGCSGIYAISKKWIDKIKRSGGSWYCPYCGQSWIYTETDVSILEEKLRLNKNLLVAEQARHDQTQASLSAQKGVTTRLKNRIKNGVCPCCNRHFKNLHRHMKNQHPDFEKLI